MPSWKQISVSCGGAVLFGLFVGTRLLIAHRNAVSPSGSDASLWAVEFRLLQCCLACIASIPVAFVLLFFRKTRKPATLILLVGLCFLLISWGSTDVAYRKRTQDFHDLADRSATLVAAIQQYAEEKGAPPKSLTDLVPEYLEEIPETGMGAYPNYEYERGPDYRQWDWEENPWALYVHTPLPGINFDMFVYLPQKNYPEIGYGGVLERIGDWAYVHE